MAQIKGIDAHDRPPDIIRQCYKKYSRLPLSEVDNDPGIIDLQKVDPESQSQFPADLTLSQYMSSQDLRLALDAFIQGNHSGQSVQGDTHAPLAENVPVYTHNAISGQQNY
jgi:hypothetical protein